MIWARKPKAPGLSPAASYVQRWAVCNNRPAKAQVSVNQVEVVERSQIGKKCVSTFRTSSKHVYLAPFSQATLVLWVLLPIFSTAPSFTCCKWIFAVNFSRQSPFFMGRCQSGRTSKFSSWFFSTFNLH